MCSRYPETGMQEAAHVLATRLVLSAGRKGGRCAAGAGACLHVGAQEPVSCRRGCETAVQARRWLLCRRHKRMHFFPGMQEAVVLLALIARGYDVDTASGRTDWGPSAMTAGGSPRAPILHRYRARQYV